MKKLILSYIGKDPHPLLVSVLDQIENVLKLVNKKAGYYEPWQIILITAIVTYLIYSIWTFINELENGLFDYFKKSFFRLAKKLPFLNAKIMKELEKTRISLEDDIIKSNKGTLFVKRLPENGVSHTDLMKKVDDYLKMNDSQWKNGAISGCVYGADDDLTKLTTNVYEKFAWANPMHADVFPDVRKMEAEVVRMVCNMFNGDADTCGTMTSGGTESIMLACKAYRDLAFANGIKHPEMVVPVTAHAAFDKAAHFFRMKIHHVPVDSRTYKVNPKKLKSYINSNTCMIAGSAPNFPNGVIDPIDELSKIAVSYKIPLHVDACLGGFLIAFMEEAGYPLPLFDFRLPGVTSISCDTHKYGYTPKGSSVVMYKNRDYRKYQYFSAVEWPGGIYVSPTFAGSRAGSLIAMTWATLMHIGQNGYVRITRDIIKTVHYITKELKTIKEIQLMAQPEVSVIAFESKDFNILRMLDEMTAKGWHLNAIQNPTGIHIAVTKLHTQPGVAEKFVKDVKDSVADIMKKEDRQLGKIAAIYCSSQSIPDKSLVADVAFMFLDACYNTVDKKASNSDDSKPKSNGISAKNGKLKQNGHK